MSEWWGIHYNSGLSLKGLAQRKAPKGSTLPFETRSCEHNHRSVEAAQECGERLARELNAEIPT